MLDKERCPKCQRIMVYSEHKDNKWRIYCKSCGLSTRWYSTWKTARTEWDTKGESR